MKKEIKVGSIVNIDMSNTPLKGSNFIPTTGKVERIQGDATKPDSYLVNGYFWNKEELSISEFDSSNMQTENKTAQEILADYIIKQPVLDDKHVIYVQADFCIEAMEQYAKQFQNNYTESKKTKEILQKALDYLHQNITVSLIYEDFYDYSKGIKGAEVDYFPETADELLKEINK